MSWLTSLAGSGTGAIAVIAAGLLIRYMSHAPRIAHPLLKRAVIVLAYAGGAALAVTAIGNLADRAIITVAGWLGGMNTGVPRLILIGVVLALLAGVIVGLAEGDDSVAMVAVFLPMLLALPFGGLLHTVGAVLNGPAITLASTLNHALAG